MEGASVRIGSFLILLTALGLGGAAAFMARIYLQNQQHVESAPRSEQREQTVVVATQPLSFGTQLTRENVVEIPWPKGNALAGSFATKDELLNDGRRVVLSLVEKNEPILASKITGPGQRATLSTLIEEGMRAVTVRVDDVKGVAGFVLPNDRVDVVLTREEDGRTNHGFADILLQNVKVLAVDQLASEKAEKPTIARAVTLELNAFQAQKIILAQGVGRLSLILNKAGNAVAERTTRVTVSDLGVPEAPATKEDNKPLDPPAAAVPLRDPNTIVNVVRDGHRREQYNVFRDGR